MKKAKIFTLLILFFLINYKVYSNDENIFKIGIGAFKDELYMVAESQFRIIVEQYQNSRYFQDSLYYLLLSQYFQKKYTESLTTISLIENKYRFIKHFPKVLYLKGRILFETGDYRNAIRSFENYLKNYPIDEDAPYSAYYMAMSYYQLTNNQRALQILEDLEKQYPNAPIIEDVKFRIAKIYFEDQKIDIAYIRFKEFENSYPNSKYLPETLYTIGKILFQKGTTQQIQTNLVYDSAIYFQKASEFQSPIRPYALFNSGVSFLLIGQYSNSKDTFSRLIEQFSISSDPNIKEMVNEATYQLAKIYRTTEDYENSIKTYKLAISQSGKFSTKSVIELSDLLNNLGNYDDAISILSQYTNTPEILLKYAEIIQTKDSETSEKILLSLITLETNTDIKNQSIIEILKILLKRGKYETIISNFRTFLTNSTDEYTTSFLYFALGEANLNLRDFRSAISSYSQVSHPLLKEDATEGIAYSHYLSENYQLAIKFYQELITKYNSEKYRDRALYLLGVCYERIKQNEEAKKYYQQLIQTGKDNKYISSGLVNLGWIYIREKRFDEAIILIQNNIQKYQEPGIYEHLSEILAWAYDGKGDQTKGIEILRNLVLQKDIPDIQKVRYYNYISLFYEKSGNLQKALDVIEKELLPMVNFKNLTNHIVESIGRIIEISLKTKNEAKARTYITELKNKYLSIQKSYEYIYNFAEYLYSNNKYEEAGREFLIVARQSQDKNLSDEAYFWAGWSYYNANKQQDAINIFNEFVNNSKSSKVSSVLLTLGDIMVNQRRFQEARNYYQRIINEFKNSPEYNEAVIRLSRISSTQQRTELSQQSQQVQQPEQTLQKQTFQQPKQQEKSIDEIISSLEGISKSKDKETASKAKFELAMIYKSQRNYQKALTLLQEITEEVYNETAAMAQFEIGEILRINGDYNRAWKEYIKVIYIYKDYKEIVVKSMYYTIFCYIQIKEYEQAKKLYEKMVRDFYKNPWTEKAKELVEKY